MEVELTERASHMERVSRIRLANMCCEGEARIARSLLSEEKGVNDVMVNVIGKYIVVKHCGEVCCSPVSEIVEKLNAKKLGASIAENQAQEDERKRLEEQGQIAGVGRLTILHCSTTLFLFIIAVALHSANGFHEPATAEMAVYLACIALGMIPVLQHSYEAIVRGRVDINVLMTIAVAGAVGSQEYLDAGLVITLFLIAKVLEDAIRWHVSNAVSISSASLPSEAVLKSGEKVKVQDLKVGDVIVVFAGDVLPVDGVVIAGDGYVDESSLTGEALPLHKAPKPSEAVAAKKEQELAANGQMAKASHLVYSGTALQNGFLTVQVSSPPGSSTFEKIAQTVTDMQAEGGKVAALVDQFAAWWTPLVLLICFVLVVVIPASIGGNSWMEWLHRGLVVLVLACPCALVVSAPIPCICAIAQAAKNGVLIKGSSIIEMLGGLQVVAIDKTGTLTRGAFSVVDQLALGEEVNALRYAAAVESQSSHPLASAVLSSVVSCVAEMVDLIPPIKNFKVLDGVGVEGWVQGEGDWVAVCVGNRRLLRENGGRTNITPEQAHALKAFEDKWPAASVLIVTVDDKLELALALADTPRPEAPLAVQRLENRNARNCLRTNPPRRVVMLTGDSENVAKNVAGQLGITDYMAACKPADKLKWVQEQVDGGVLVAMVGDGINDAMALAAASVGVSMGASAASITMNTADVIIMSENLLRFPAAVALANEARNVVFQNIAIASLIKIVAVILAVLGYLELWEAVLVDIGSLMAVLGNGMRVLRSSAFRGADVKAGDDDDDDDDDCCGDNCQCDDDDEHDIEHGACSGKQAHAHDHGSHGHGGHGHNHSHDHEHSHEHGGHDKAHSQSHSHAHATEERKAKEEEKESKHDHGHSHEHEHAHKHGDEHGHEHHHDDHDDDHDDDHCDVEAPQERAPHCAKGSCGDKAPEPAAETRAPEDVEIDHDDHDDHDHDHDHEHGHDHDDHDHGHDHGHGHGHGHDHA